MKTIEDSLGRSITVFDSVFTKAYHEHVYHFVSNSLYRIGSQDGPATIERRNQVYIHSEYSADDINTLAIIPNLKKSEAGSMIEGKKIVRATVNLSVPSDTNFVHTHINQLAAVYYCNVDWKPEWAGETMFYNEDYSDIIYSCMYKPNRLVFFDGSIPHSLRPQSDSAPHYRFTLALFFNDV